MLFWKSQDVHYNIPFVYSTPGEKWTTGDKDTLSEKTKWIISSLNNTLRFQNTFLHDNDEVKMQDTQVT